MNTLPRVRRRALQVLLFLRTNALHLENIFTRMDFEGQAYPSIRYGCCQRSDGQSCIVSFSSFRDCPTSSIFLSFWAPPSSPPCHHQSFPAHMLQNTDGNNVVCCTTPALTKNSVSIEAEYVACKRAMVHRAADTSLYGHTYILSGTYSFP